ncbi:Light-sensor Protein kinase [Tetrabaena socialis]|uniref:Light-sensor Protein kinase n=1 Tax=Tetrabaena socialis TaxID=47790 RepID=A0A2J8A8A0_9CHLO|nr:Light-sensor Protein kinase [Tetrabaena socialis]|eukprot:PNH08762.1 Light-sensor Protein kinase [Tetrabaena socialis]
MPLAKYPALRLPPEPSLRGMADVFSFGVVLYELFTRTLLIASHVGTKRQELPYVLNTVEDFATVVSRGYRPSRMTVIPFPIWATITDCWQQDPLRRPSMSVVAQRLLRIAAEDSLSAEELSSGANGSGRQPGCAGCVIS